MKIGVFTLPLENNYGGNLQNFALQQVLKEMGHEVVTIDWHRKKEYGSFARQFIGYIHRLYSHYIKKEKISTCWCPFFSEKEFDIISSNIRPFINKNIALTRKICQAQLKEIDNEYKFDAYVVGSDQVWVHSYALSAFLDFVDREGVIKVAYAASSNERAWTRYQDLVPLCKQLSESFSGLSVRENFLKKETEKILKRDIKLVLDPVLLLNPDKYLSLLQGKNNPAPFGFAYILDKSESKTSIIQRISKEKGISFISGMPRKAHVRERNMNLNDYIFPSVEDWIYGMSQADTVVTDSFHGIAFSILFNKNFVVIPNARRGMERFKSLLSIFNLENRMVSNAEEAMKVIKRPIEYDRINETLNSMRADSLSFLNKSLSENYQIIPVNDNIHFSL